MFIDDFSKLFIDMEDLAKKDMTLAEALRLARKHVPNAGKVIAKHLYTDTLVPSVGNKFAYKQFVNGHGDTGVHVHSDLNGFKAINDEFGHDIGDDAIKQYFNLSSKFSRKYGGKNFRVSGDEGRLHFADADRANAFVKELHDELKKHPKIAGKHRMSVSMGMGYTPDHAEKALLSAKNQLGPLIDGKRNKINKSGEEENVVFSLLHEMPPEHWRPSAADLPHEKREPIVSNALKLNHPLK